MVVRVRSLLALLPVAVSLVALVGSLLPVSDAQSEAEFKATVSVVNDPLAPGAELAGTLVYKEGAMWSLTPNSGSRTANFGGSYCDTANGILYTRCGSADPTGCAAEFHQLCRDDPGLVTQQFDTAQSSVTITSSDSRTCSLVQKAAAGAYSFENAVNIYKDVSSPGLLCRADLQDPTAAAGIVGRTYSVSSVVATVPADVAPPAGCSAAAAMCRSAIDLVVIIDTVAAAEVFEEQKELAAAAVEKFDLNEFTGVRVAVVLMSNSASTKTYIKFNAHGPSVANAIRGLSSETDRDDSKARCISCAMERAETIFSDARTGVMRAVLFFVRGPAGERFGDEPLIVQRLCDVDSVRMQAMAITTPGEGISVADARLLSCQDGKGYSGIQLSSFLAGMSLAAQPAKDLCLIAADFAVTGAGIASGRCGPTCGGTCGCNRQCDCPRICECGGASGGTCVANLTGNGCICPGATCASTDACGSIGSYPNCTSVPSCAGGSSDPCVGPTKCNSRAGCFEVPPDCGALLPSGEACKYAVCTANVGCEVIDVGQCGPVEEETSFAPHARGVGAFTAIVLFLLVLISN